MRPEGGGGLDQNYPYQNKWDMPLGDAPGTLLNTIYSTESMTFHATIYLMWQYGPKPPNPNGSTIPVSLGYVSWMFTGHASNSTVGMPIEFQIWTGGGAGGPLGAIDHTFVPSSPDQPSHGLPTWTTVSLPDHDCPNEQGGG